MTTTQQALKNKFYLLENEVNGEKKDCIRYIDASLFKIVDIEDMHSHAAFLITVQHMAGNLDKVFDYIGTTDKGSLYRISYKQASSLVSSGVANLTDWPNYKNIINDNVNQGAE